MSKREKLARSFAHHPWLWLLGLLLTVIPAAVQTSHLRIKSDFKTLLPANKPSVVALDRIVERVGGVGNLAIAIESNDIKVTEQFIEDLVARLRKLPKPYVKYVEYNSKGVRQFYTDNRNLYVDLDDLREIRNRLSRKIRYEKLKNNPLFISLEDEKVAFDVSDIENKYKGQTSKYDAYIDGYYFGEGGKIAAVILQPYGSATGVQFAKDLVARVSSIVSELNPSSYHASMRVTLAGKYRRVLEEYDQLIKDVLSTLALCLLLVAAVLFLYFLRLRAIWLLTAPLAIGTLWAFALTKIQIGYLNSQTAFLGSIIVGNGVNSGIILLARYIEERRQGKNIEEALAVAYSRTMLGTFVAAITTSAAFATLAFSEIRGFTQFGFIGGVGMLLCWVATYLVLPPLLVLSERAIPIVRDNRLTPKQWEFIFYPVGSLVAHSPRLIAGFGVFLTVASIGLALRFLPNSLEYDFSKLKNKVTDSPYYALGQRIQDIFGQNLAPVMILLDDEKQANFICDAVMKREAHLSDHLKTIDYCKTLQSYLPANQPEKQEELRKIRHLLADHSLNFVDKKYRKEIDDFRKSVDVRSLTLRDLPDQIRRNYQEVDGTLGRVVYVYPRPDVDLADGRKLIQFADMLSDIRLPDGTVVRMSGESAIFADLLRAIKTDGPIATLLSFIAVALCVIVTFRRPRPITYVLGGLIVGIAMMFGLQAILQIRLNFFNFIALPVTFGIGVDYGVNLLQRYKYEGRGSVRRVLGAVGGAIVLCSLTTIIGYATLLTAMNQALASFGWLGLLGEVTCIFAAIVIMPAILHSFDRRLQGVPDKFEEKREAVS
ncbi:MAG: MMPL family transporter [Pseudomonadota bacterium]